MPKADEILLARAKAMRSNPTPAEARLWYHFCAKRFERVKFNHQVVVAPYIADFVARLRKIVFELDGDSHADNERCDTRRTAWFERQGYRVIRFRNADVMSNLEGVSNMVSTAIGTNPFPRGEREKKDTPLPGGKREKKDVPRQ